MTEIAAQMTRIRRINIKCKRKSTLIKKCSEIASLCQLKMCLVLFDENKNELLEYSTTEDFGVHVASEKISSYQALQKENR